MTKEELQKTDLYLGMSFDSFLEKACKVEGELDLLNIFYQAHNEEFLDKLPLRALIRLVQTEGGNISLTIGDETWEYSA